ncbi:hypothetical protein PFISCL1PPCAC_1503, partial [Pristionchus fissidentatus]
YFRTNMGHSPVQQYQFTVLMVIVHAIILVLFGLFVSFDDTYAMPEAKDDNTFLNTRYPNYMDTHIMIFVGFGFLMTFLKRYGFSSVAINMLLAALTIEWGILCRGFLTEHFAETGKITLNIDQLLEADFAAAVILISMGVLLGKLSPIQYVIMVLIETPAAIAAEHLVEHVFKINDVGDSIVVHVFGAYFGIACSLAFAKKKQRGHENEGSIYHTDILAMIGALFLWVSWPSFNAATAEPAEAHHRAIINTVLSLVGCTITTFLTSQLFEPHKRFNMVHIANSTLAGGVAIGTCANVVMDPILSIALGSFAGVISVLGYIYLTPFLSTRFGMHDTCGVHNLHGMPGVIAGLFSAVMAVAYPKEKFGASLSSIYPAMAHDGQTESGQALMQLAGLGTVLGCSIIAGAVTGVILRAPFFNQVRDDEYFADGDYFHTPDDYDFTTRIAEKIQHVSFLDEEQKTKLTMA